MPIVLANPKKATLLQTRITYLNTLKLVLWGNNVTPDGDTTISALGPLSTATPSSYTGVGFITPVLNGANKGQTTAPDKVFVMTHPSGDYTVYGYAFVDPATSDSLVFCEKAGTPFLVTVAGLVYIVSPKYTNDTM